MVHENDWKVELKLYGLHVEYRWVDYVHNGESHGHMGEIINLTTGELLVHADYHNKNWIEKAIMNAVSQIRVTEIQEIYKDRIFEVKYSHREKMADLIMELYDKSVSGYYLGQSSVFSNMLYVQDIVKILDVNMATVFEVVQQMIEDKKIGLYGMIFIPYRTYAENKRIGNERSGHKDFSSSDFGSWSCRACGASGDEYADPLDFECK